MSRYEIGPVTPQSICTEHQDQIGSLRIGCKVCQEQAEAKCKDLEKASENWMNQFEQMFGLKVKAEAKLQTLEVSYNQALKTIRDLERRLADDCGKYRPKIVSGSVTQQNFNKGQNDG